MVAIAVVLLVAAGVLFSQNIGQRKTAGRARCTVCSYEWDVNYTYEEMGSLVCPECGKKAEPLPIYGLDGPESQFSPGGAKPPE